MGASQSDSHITNKGLITVMPPNTVQGRRASG